MHIPVLLHEAVNGLALSPGDTVIDGTLGAGGHASEIAERLQGEVTIIGFDLDQSALSKAEKRVKENGAKLIPIHSNFRFMKAECEKRGIKEVSAVLLDLGLSSMELDSATRGFSFRRDEPLIMTLDDKPAEGTLTAEELVNSYPEHELADIIYKYGEERFSRQIAKGIAMARRRERITTTTQLVEIISRSVPVFYTKGRINPATKTFQAIRIAVNDELGALVDGLVGAWEILKPGGRIAVITFHSLEDRIVKNFFKEKKENKTGVPITKKPIIPTREEIEMNPRSRSAKLRVMQKISL